jgi:predicted GTPase
MRSVADGLEKQYSDQQGIIGGVAVAEWNSRKEQEAAEKAVRDFHGNNKDPRFLVLGATGVGKSSLINRVFRADLHAVGDVKSTTRSFSTRIFQGDDENTILITDSPGYGEIGHDDDYSRQVVDESRNAHVVILVLKADDKGYQRDLDILSKVFRSPEFQDCQPLVIALNHVDKLPPVRDWRPPYRLDLPESPEDSDKVRNIKQKIALVREQFGSIFKAGAALCVCPTMSEPREGEIFGIQHFREKLFDAMPQIAKLKYARASRVAEEASRETMEKLDKLADRIIGGNAAAAFSAVLLNPVPVSDWLFIAPIQMSMIVEVGAVYGKTIDLQAAKETAYALGAGLAARTIFQGIISLFPGVKNIVGPPYAAAATHGMGVAAKMYFKSGKRPSKEVIQEAVDEELKRRKEN